MNGTKTLVAALGAGMLLCTAAPSFADTAADTLFLTNAIRGNMAEIKTADLAEQRAASEDVRDYGKMLSNDHAKALQKHAGVARDKNVPVPTEVTQEQKQQYDALAKLSGAEFDREFMQHMIDEHQKVITMYEAEAASKGDPDVVDLAKDTLPKLRDHLAEAQKIATGGATRTSQRTDHDRRLE